MNRERAKEGKNPIYLKKRDIKALKYKEKFDKLNSDYRLEKEF